MKAFVIALFLALALTAGCKDKTQAPAQEPETVQELQPQAQAPDEIPNMTQDEKVSYSVGLRIAPSIYEVYGVVDMDWFSKGYKDAQAGNATLLTDQQVDQIMNAREIEVRENKRMLAKIISDKAQEMATKYSNEVNSFIDDFKAQDGVVVRDSGLMYKVLAQGSGDSPAAYDEVLLNYEGRLVNGTVFDSTYTRKQPVSLVVQGTIPGMIEALQSMHPGDHWEVLIPPDLAYGTRGVGPVPPNSALIFDLELLKINQPESEAAPAGDTAESAPNAS